MGDELRALLQEAVQQGTIDEGREKILSSAFRFSDLKVRQIMTPRMKVDFLKLDQPYEGAVSFLRQMQSSFSLVLCTARQFSARVSEQLDQQTLTQYFAKVCVVQPGANAGLRKADATSELKLCAVVGDTESDAQWAEAAHATFIPVAWGFRNFDFWASRNRTSADKWEAVIRSLPAASPS